MIECGMGRIGYGKVVECDMVRHNVIWKEDSRM